MIIVRLYAGLGNQMFQYAAAKALALRLQAPLKLDITSFDTDQLCTYDLEFFNIEADIATKAEIYQYTTIPSGFFLNIIYRFKNHLYNSLDKYSFINECFYHYDNEFERATRKAYITGLWQSEKYFNSYNRVFRKHFTLRHPSEEKRIDIVNLIRQTNSVSITIRRGDYLKHPELNLYGDNLTFYYQAVRQIKDQVTNPFFFIFSDDIQWVRENLLLGDNQIYYVSEPYQGEIYKVNPRRHLDLLLISYCKHHIIPNSTFAWWGAWLSDYERKIVLTPKKWFGDSFVLYNQSPNTKDVIPNGWYKI